ncbi:hypothetical protein [Streptomyces sp. CAU 1734]|uniref:hypothetical protein n=1 Tax=Streptomyces sp. CAU 1734 TaxID=3140360 RepID=UPI0032611035
METPSEHTGVLILRVWVEDGGPDGFRARVLRSVDGHRAPPLAAGGADDVIAAVRTWLNELLEARG